MPAPIVGLLLPLVSDAINSVVSNKKQAQALTASISSAITGKDAEFHQLIKDANDGQVRINQIEAAHRSLFIAGWRPMAGWACSIGICWMFVGQPLMTGLFAASGIDISVPELPDDILLELLLALLGMAGIRSFDKLKGTTI